MKIIYPYIFLRFFLLLIGLFLPLCYTIADEEKGGYNRTTQEYQLKYAVPSEVAAELWLFITKQYNTAGLRKYYPGFSSQLAYQTCIDEYYDDADYTLLKQLGSVRHRRLFYGKEVEREFVQVKFSTVLQSQFSRQEVKFNLNNHLDKKATFAGHPFLALIRKPDMPHLDSALSFLQVKSKNMRSVIQLNQTRKRLYLLDDGNELAYISLDYVSTQNPDFQFYELELALNENTYTTAKAAQKEKLRHVLELLQLEITKNFSDLKLDQLPKYNKMYNLHKGNQQRPGFYNITWLGIAVLLTTLAIYLYLTRNRPAPRPLELI